MANPTQSDHAKSDSRQPPDRHEEEYAQLRTLLLAPEQTELDHLRERLDHQTLQAQEVSRVLPEAFAIRGQSDPHIAAALTPYVEQGLKTSVRQSPQVIVDAIAPVLGPAIRQAIVRALQGMLQSVNQTLGQGISIRGLRWRVEAWRTGKSFAEIVLLHTLRFRVEQVFLIHRDTGILLQHVAMDSGTTQNHDLVSGMLTTILQFVTDSVGSTHEPGLEQYHVGDLTIWVEQGPRALLAAVVRGTPPQSLRTRFARTLEQIHIDAADSLNTFNGDNAPFSAYRAQLEACLDAEYQTPVSRISLITWAVLTLLSLGLVAWGWFSYQRHLQWTTLLDRLRTEPGLVVTSVERTGGHYMIAGLRDPLAVDPAGLITAAGFAAEDVRTRWAPYYSLDSQFIETRLRQILKPPSTVRISVDNQSVTVSGTAPEDWAREAKRVASMLPGVGRYRDESLRTISIPQLVKNLTSTRILFESGSSSIAKAEETSIEAVKSSLKDLDQLAQEGGKLIVVDIIGSTDERGPESMNLILGMARAHAVLAAIGEKAAGPATKFKTGVEHPQLAASAQRKSNDSTSRGVTFHVTVKDAPRDRESRS